MKRNRLFITAALLTLASLGNGLASTAVAPPVNGAGTLANADIVAGVAPLDVSKLKSGQLTLNVGHYSQLPPFYFSTGNPQPGLGQDIFNEVIKKTGIKNINYIAYDNDIDLNAKLQQGKIDIIANSWDLPGMRKKFLLTEPYYTQGGLSFLYFKQKGSFQTAEDLKGHNVGVFKHGYADRFWLPAHGVDQGSVKAYSTIKELMFALKDGDIDVAVIYYPLARLAQQQLTDQLNSTLVQSINDVYAVRKQDAQLQAALNQALESLKKDGTLEKIQAQYLPNPQITPQNPHA